MAQSNEIFEIRLATAADFDALLQLEREALAAASKFRGSQDLKKVSVAESFPAILESRLNAVYVAVSSHVVVGYVVVSTAQVASRACIDKLFVHPQARELGIGAALVSEAQRFAELNECTHLEANALPGDRESKNLYERAGMPARSITMSKTL